jgi:hypothetical protein
MPQICYYIAMSRKKPLNERSRKGLSPAVTSYLIENRQEGFLSHMKGNYEPAKGEL